MVQVLLNNIRESAAFLLLLCACPLTGALAGMLIRNASNP